MANTYELIASYTTGGSQVNSIDFTSIPQTYTDLELRVSVRSIGQVWGWVTFNGTITGNYSQLGMYTQGVSAGGAGIDNATSSTTSYQYSIYNSWGSSTASVYGGADFYIPSYTATTLGGRIIRSHIFAGNMTGSGTPIYNFFKSYVWENTSAITQINIIPYNAPSNKWDIYSTAYLYGIKSS